MPSRYAQWMYEWEHRLTSVDNNRVVRPLEWGVEWARDWPCRNGVLRGRCRPTGEVLHRLQPAHHRAQRRILFVCTPTDSGLRIARCRCSARARFRIQSWKKKCGELCRVPAIHFARANALSRKQSGECALVSRPGRRAVVLLPHWNSDAISYVGLCRVLNWLGIAVLRLSMPYHDIRMPAEIRRADYAVSANIGRTLDAVRQGVIDVRCCLDWLEQQGYSS